MGKDNGLRWYCPNCGRLADEDKNMANAALIAAAPDLLEGLKKAVSLIEDVATHSATELFYQHHAASLQSIINKAEGRD